MVQNRTACLALLCSMRKGVDQMHCDLAWMKVEDRLTCSLLTLFRNKVVSKQPNCLYSKITFTLDRHEHRTRLVSRAHVSIPLPKSNAMKRTAMYRACSQWNRLPYAITQARSKESKKKKKTTKNVPFVY